LVDFGRGERDGLFRSLLNEITRVGSVMALIAVEALQVGLRDLDTTFL
jgi:hypothetical protein